MHKTIVFDLDGTMINTSMDLLDSLNHCLSEMELKHVVYEDLTFLVGQGAKVMIRRAFELNDKVCSDADLERALPVFIAHYEANMPGRSVFYPGFIDALDHLQNDGLKFAVCTNKMDAMAKKLLTELNVIDRFEAVAGGDAFAMRKPDGRHILQTIELAGGDPEQSIMIGDSVNDIKAAKDANIPSIAVPFGFSDVPVADLDPDHIINHFDELTTELVDKLLR